MFQLRGLQVPPPPLRSSAPLFGLPTPPAAFSQPPPLNDPEKAHPFPMVSCIRQPRSIHRLGDSLAPASQVWHAEPIPKPNLTERGLPTWSTVDSSLCGKSVREEETNRRRLDGIGDTLLLWEKVLREIGLLFLHGLPSFATHPRIPTQ